MRRLAPEIEQAYREARFAEYRGFSLRVGIAGALLTLGLWARDLISDPSGAHGTLEYRFVDGGRRAGLRRRARAAPAAAAWRCSPATARSW